MTAAAVVLIKASDPWSARQVSPTPRRLSWYEIAGRDVVARIAGSACLAWKQTMPQQITKHVHALVEGAEREIETLSAADAIKLHGRGDVVFVDIRDIRELNRDGRVPGAFHCP